MSLEALEKGRRTRLAFLLARPFDQQGYVGKKRIVIEDQNGKCLVCGTAEWMGKPIRLALDHIDGDNKNDKRENLRALCPNCHSQTETYCGKNTCKRVEESVLVEAIKKAENIRQVLLSVGLTPKAANYERVSEIMKARNLVFGRVVELAYTSVLRTDAERIEGSTPSAAIRKF